MKLSKKSLGFAKKILHHYPPSSTNTQGFAPYAHLHDHRKEREIYQRPTPEKLQNMAYFKEQGNVHYKQEKYEEAAYFYNKVIIYGDYTFPETPQQENSYDLLLQQANMNLAICFIKTNKWEQVDPYLREAEKAKIQGKSIKEQEKCKKTQKKSLYWQVKNHLRKGSYQEAEEKIKKLQELDGICQEVKELRALVLKNRTQQEEREKTISMRMMNM